MALSKYNRSQGCFFQCGEPCTEEDEDFVPEITKHAPTRWEKFKNQAYLWRGLDRFGEIYDTVDWKKGGEGLVMHDKCRITFMTDRKLKQAMKRKEKETNLKAQQEKEKADTAGSSQMKDDNPFPRATRSSFGSCGLHDKNKCVWCFKPPDAKHPDPSNPFRCIEYKSGWEKFKRHTIYLTDPLQKERLNRLIESVYDDPYAAEIRYHHKCWMKHVHDILKKHDDEKQALQVNVSLREAQTEFFDIVEGVIFEQHEIRSLQSLKHDYKRTISMYGFHVDGIQSSYVKNILKREFKERIGFHSRPQKNLSELVYDTSAGGSYIETALTSVGISSDQLIDNLTKRIISSVKETGTITWPPTVDELEEEETYNHLLLNTVRALARKPKDDMSPDLLSLTSLLTQLILKEPTPTAIRSTVTRHGISRSREMVDTDSKLGIGIPYEKLLFLRDTWALHDMQSADDCPRDIAEGKPGIGILDNDDFREDTLTGKGTSHRTNYMLIQKEVSIGTYCCMT